MGLFKSKQEKIAELMTIYSQSFYRFCKIDRYRQYTRLGLTDDLNKLYTNASKRALDAQRKILAYDPEYEEMIDSLSATAMLQAAKDLEEKYGPIPEPDAKFILSIMENNKEEYLNMVECGVAYKFYSASARIMEEEGRTEDAAKCEEHGKNAYILAMDIGESLHLHDNETMECINEYYDELAENKHLNLIQGCLDIFHQMEDEM